MVDWQNVIISSFPVIGALGGAFIGGYFTSKSSSRVTGQQIQREREKEKHERKISKLKTYSLILEIDGEDLIVSTAGLNWRKYMDVVRPILYKDFYNLDQNVADIIEKMDDLSQEAEFHGDKSYRKTEWELAELYWELIGTINDCLKAERKHLIDY